MAQVTYLFAPMARAQRTDNLPNRLREHRLAAGLSLDALGKLVGLTRVAVGLHERGERALKDFQARRYAEALGIHPSDLLSPTDNPFQLDAPMREHLEHLRGLDPFDRRTVYSLAENLAGWRAQPPDEDDQPKRA